MQTFIERIATYLPKYLVTNKDIQHFFNIPEEWVQMNTGNSRRYYSFDLKHKSVEYTVADLAVGACERLFRQHDDRSEIEAIILTSGTPDNLIPTTVNIVADRMHLNNIKTFQLLAGCSGAIQAIEFAVTLLKSYKFKKVLVVGVDSIAKFIDLSRDFKSMKARELVNYALFGDGAGAAIITNNKGNDELEIEEIMNEVTGMGTDGAQRINWFGYVPLKDDSVSITTWRRKFVPVSENYSEIQKRVPKLTNKVIKSMIKDHQTVNYYLPPQLNSRMTDHIIQTSRLSFKKAINAVGEVGNCGNALPFFQLKKLQKEIKHDETAVCVSIESSKWIITGIRLKGAKLDD